MIRVIRAKRVAGRAAVIAVAAVALAGLTGGCDNGSSYPPGVIKYVNIDNSPNNDTLPQVASDGTNFLVVYDEIVTDTNHHVIGALFNQHGKLLIYVLNLVTPNDDRVPHVAFDGANYLVVYQEDNGGDHDIMGVFVSPAGALVGAPFAIDASTDDDLAPAVAYDGANYLVAYQRANGDIIGAMVAPSGAVGSSFPIDTATHDDLPPAVASNGTDFLVAYQRVVSNIVGARVDGGGAVEAGSPFNIDATGYDNSAPQAASDGTNYLVVYQRTFSTDRDIQGALVAAGPAVTLFDIDAEYGYDDYAPCVAWSGTRYLVPYTETFSSTDHDILEAHVSSSGAVKNIATPIDNSPYDDFSPAVAFGSGKGLVPYEETYTNTDHNIFGALMKP
jgi:hypothetical protein